MRPNSLRVLLATLCAATIACAPRDQMPEQPSNGEVPGTPAAQPPADASAEPLIASVQANPVNDRVQFVLQVTNSSSAAVPLEFSSGQSYDFVVVRDNREIWRWSEGQFFTMALRSESLEPGGTLRFEESWTPPAGASGEYTVVGILTATNQRTEQASTFRLP